MARFSGGSGGGEGTVGPAGPQGPAGADGAQGPGFVFAGQWDFSHPGYEAGSVVRDDSLNLYVAVQFVPTTTAGLNDTNYWQPYLSSVTGPAGADGEDATLGTETSFTVNGGTLGAQPTFDGDPLFSGSYVKNGPLVHFQIQVDMDNITNFGTGQYYVELPFPAKHSYHFRDACLHDSSGTVRQYALSGHVYAGQSQVALWFTSTSGQDELFDYNSPALLTVNDNFHISGTYIAE